MVALSGAEIAAAEAAANRAAALARAEVSAVLGDVVAAVVVAAEEEERWLSGWSPPLSPQVLANFNDILPSIQMTAFKVDWDRIPIAPLLSLAEAPRKSPLTAQQAKVRAQNANGAQHSGYRH